MQLPRRVGTVAHASIPHQTAPQLAEERYHLRPSQLLVQNHLSLCIDEVTRAKPPPSTEEARLALRDLASHLHRLRSDGPEAQDGKAKK